MSRQVRITVLKREFYPELADEYLAEGRKAGPCPILAAYPHAVPARRQNKAPELYTTVQALCYRDRFRQPSRPHDCTAPHRLETISVQRIIALHGFFARIKVKKISRFTCVQIVNKDDFYRNIHVQKTNVFKARLPHTNFGKRLDEKGKIVYSLACNHFVTIDEHC